MVTAIAPALVARRNAPSRMTLWLRQPVEWLVLTWKIRYAVAFSLILRLVLLAFSAHNIVDPANHHGSFGAEVGWVARSLALGRGFSSPFFPVTGSTALVPPLYTIALSLIFRCFGVYTLSSAVVALTLQSLLSAATCVVIAQLANQICGPRSAALAAWTWAVYPYAVHYCAAEVWDYALTALLFTTAMVPLVHADRRNAPYATWLGRGVLAGMATLSNPSVTLALLAVAALRLAHAERRSRAARLFMIYVAGIAVVCGPWCWRNFTALGEISPVRDGLWLEVWAGNHGDISLTNPPSAHPASSAVEMRSYQQMGEREYVQTKHDAALAYMKAHPMATAVVSGRRALRFWTGFWSMDAAYLEAEPFDLPNVLFCATLSVLMLQGLRRTWRWNRTVAQQALAVLILFPLPYYLTHASMDYRQPIEPLIVVLLVRAMPLSWLARGRPARRVAALTDQMANV